MTQSEAPDPPASDPRAASSLMLEVSQAVSGTLHLEQVLQTISDGTAELLSVETAAIYLLEGGLLYLGATTPALPPDTPDSVRWAKLSDHRHLKQSMDTRKPVMLVDALAADLLPEERAVMEMRQLQTVVFLPFYQGDQPLGVLILGTISEKREITKRELALCETLTYELALGVQKARLHERLQEHARQLEHEVEERRHVELELRRSEARFRALFEQAGDYMLLLEERADGVPHILEANEAACTTHGYTYEQLLGAPVSLLDHTQAVAPDGPVMRELREQGLVRFESEHTRRDGSTFPVDVTLKRVFLEDGQSLFMSIERDLTERHRLEGQLRHAQKMEAVGQLAGGIAHDFNNLLQIIEGFTDLARQSADEGGEIDDALGYVSRASQRASLLVRQLLAFARRQHLSLKDVDVRALVDALQLMLEPLLGEGIALKVKGAAGTCVARADPHGLEQILVNLCVNARDAMARRGVLTIELDEVDIDAELASSLQLQAEGRYARLRISDTGCGIDDQTLEHIFDPFFTTKRPGEGTGLGLATVDGLVAQHHGALRVQSKLGEGTTFFIHLPAGQRDSTRPVATRPEPGRPASGRVLVAEDQEMIRTLTRSYLEQAGYAVIEAKDGRQAIEIVRDSACHLDLLVLDAVMPHASGAEVLEAARKERPDVPVLFCSGYGTMSLEEGELQRPDVEFLAKPYSEAGLLSAVAGLLSKVGTEASLDPNA